MQTFLGINTNGAAVTKEEAAQLIALPLKITDAKKNAYTIDSYQFLYKRKSVVQDEETGKNKVHSPLFQIGSKLLPCLKYGSII